MPKLEPFDMFLPGTPPVTPREELGICYSLSGSELDRKVRGIQEHASQIEGLLKVFGEDGLRRFMAEEYYPLEEQFGLDSMDLLNYIAGLEEGAGIRIPEPDYAKVSSPLVGRHPPRTRASPRVVVRPG